MRDADPDNPLFDVLQAVVSCQDPPSALALLARSARRLIGCDGVTVVMREGNLCRYVEEDAVGALWKGQAFAPEECVSGWCIRSGEAVAIADTRSDERVPQSLYRATFVRSMAMVPIRREQPVGALGIYWATPHAARGGQIRTLWALANAAARTLENLWLVERLRRENARKDAFLSSLAHELGECLGPMRTSLHVRQTSGDQRAQARANEILEAQLARQGRLIQTLQDSSDLLTGRVRLQVRPLDLRDVVSTVAQARASDASAAEVEFSYVLPSDGVPVQGDRDRLQQALHRVLDNSFRCTPPGGLVAIELRCAGGEALLAVRDTGVGVEASALPHLFEPFFKPADEPARSLSGLGLGLSVVSSLVRLHGGSVSMESEGCGRGAVVALRLPLASTPAAAGVPNDTAALDSRVRH